MVPLDLIGQTIGTRGSNIKKAQQIRGVFSVDTEKQPGGECRFRIFGEVNNMVFIYILIYILYSKRPGPLNMLNFSIISIFFFKFQVNL